MIIEFCSLVDKKYTIGAFNLLKAFKKFGISHRLNFLYENEFDELNDLKNEYFNINLIKVKKEDYNFNIDSNFRNWNINCFFRFDMFEIQCDKLIFLDLDILILNKLDYILNFKGDFGAVLEIDRDQFNGGVLVIGKKFLNKKTKTDLINISNTKIWSSDQPVLNLYFKDYLTPLPKRFNVLTSEFLKVNEVDILHYIGSKKPWDSNDMFKNYDKYVLESNNIKSISKLQKIYDNY